MLLFYVNCCYTVLRKCVGNVFIFWDMVGESEGVMKLLFTVVLLCLYMGVNDGSQIETIPMYVCLLVGICLLVK